MILISGYYGYKYQGILDTGIMGLLWILVSGYTEYWYKGLLWILVSGYTGYWYHGFTMDTSMRVFYGY